MSIIIRQWLGSRLVSHLLNIEPTTVRGTFSMAPIQEFAGYDYGCYIIRYGLGAFKAPHKDPSPNWKQRHYRLVCVLQEAGEGGDLYVGGERRDLRRYDAFAFRADLEEHWVTPVTKGERIILTLGKLLLDPL